MTKSQRGQSFTELALVLPILLLLLAGLVEVGFFINRYLDALDLTREAARFASNRDPFSTNNDFHCSEGDALNFYYDVACFFSPPAYTTTADPACQGLPAPDGFGGGPVNGYEFCNGFLPYLTYKSDQDDVVISVFTITTPGDQAHILDEWRCWPDGGSGLCDSPKYWALSDNDWDFTHSGNWQKDCQGNVVQTDPYFTANIVNGRLDAGAPPNKAMVAVEFYYCYWQILHVPVFYQLIPNPLKVHAYTIMAIPAAQPSATPLP
jgi:hypothetical protein